MMTVTIVIRRGFVNTGVSVGTAVATVATMTTVTEHVHGDEGKQDEEKEPVLS